MDILRPVYIVVLSSALDLLLVEMVLQTGLELLSFPIFQLQPAVSAWSGPLSWVM